MALDAPRYNQTVPIKFSSGVDTKSDPYGVQPPKLLSLINGTFQHPGELTTRNGYRAVASLSQGARMLTTFNGTELIAADDYQLYSLNQGTNTLIQKSDLFKSITTSISDVVRNTYNQTNPTSATDPVTGLQCFAYVDGGSGGVNYALVDSNTNNVIISSTVLDATGILPLVICAGGNMLIYYYDTSSTELNVAVIPCGAPFSTPAITTLTDTGGSSNQMYATAPTYDVNVVNLTSGPTIILAFTNVVTSPTNFITVKSFSPIFPTTVVAVESAPTYALYASAISVLNNDQNNGMLGIAFYALDTDLSAGVVALAQLDWQLGLYHIKAILPSSTSIGSVISLGGYYQTVQNKYTVLWSQNTAGTRPSVQGNTCSYDLSSLGTQFTISRSSSLAAKPFIASDDCLYAPVIQVSPKQCTYFIQNINCVEFPDLEPGYIASYILYGSAAQAAPVTILGACSNIGTQVQFAASVVDQLESIATPASAGVSTLVSQTGVTSIVLDYGSPNPTTSYQHAEFGSNLLISGGFLQAYDGQSVSENGFFIYPEGTTWSTNDPGTAFTWTYAIVYSWEDAQGQTSYSYPEPLIVTMNNQFGSAGLFGIAGVTLTIPTLSFTNKSDNVTITVYRSQANVDSTTVVYYQVYSSLLPTNSPLVPIFNNTSVDTITFLDEISDVYTIGNETIYTTGGVLPNFAPPPVSAICVHQNQCYLVDSTHPTNIWYSQLASQGVPAQFTNAFVLQVPGADITALAEMDSNLIIFKSGATIGQSILYLTGIGPDATGNQSGYSIPQPITTDCGCISPRSISLVQEGLLYQSEKGLYTLLRSLSVVYSGADVEGYTTQKQLSGFKPQNLATVPSQIQLVPIYTSSPVQVTNTTLMANVNQARYALVTGETLVWDYFVKQWSVFTGASAKAMTVTDACIWNGQYTWLREDGTIWQETPGVYADPDGAFISMSLLTSWLTLTGIENYQRAKEFLLLGEYFSPHNLLVNIMFDNNPISQQQIVIPVGQNINPAWGGDESWGGPPDTAFGGNLSYPVSPYQFRIFLAKHRCQSMQISLQTATAGIAGQSCSLSGFNLTVSSKRGAFKPSGSITYG